MTLRSVTCVTSDGWWCGFNASHLASSEIFAIAGEAGGKEEEGEWIVPGK